MQKVEKYCLFSILIFGLALRIFSLDYGLPYLFGPDETRQVLDSLSFGARKSIIPLEYTYPALHKYVLAFAFGLYFVIGLIFNYFKDVADFVFKFLINPENIFLIGRILSTIFSLLLVIPVYKLAKLISSKEAGVVASIFSLFLFNLSAHAQWATADSMLVFFSTYAFYEILKCQNAPVLKNFVLAGLMIGLSTATKYQGAYIIVPFLLVVFFNFRQFLQNKPLFVFTAISLLLAGLIFSLANLSFFFDFAGSFKRLVELKDETMGISSYQPFEHSFLSVIIWFIRELIRQENTIGFLLIVGIAYSFYKHKKEDWIFISYMFFCLFSIVGFGFRSLHILMYTFGIMSVFAARLFLDLLKSLAKNKYNLNRITIIAFILVIPSIVNILLADLKRINPDTRILAKNWIEQNIPKQTRIAIDWYDLSVPLISEVPALFQDDKLKSYYLNWISPKIKERYDAYIKNKQVYDLTQIRYQSKEAIWPKDMPEEARLRLEDSPLMRRLYQWFNFKNIDELKNEKVSFVVISSYSYNHFLFDDDARKKTGLFNPYMLEDTLSSNRHAKVYDKDSKYGKLFYLAKRARDFYLPLLDNKLQGCSLVKEFNPGGSNIGPAIKIYRLKY